jgi:hypothetical protein
MLSDPDFVPFEPPPRPLGLRGLPTLWRNYIETIPRPAYEEGMTRVRTRYSDVLLVCDPDVIGEILVDKADAFGRDPATRRVVQAGGRRELHLCRQRRRMALAAPRRGADLPA